jgi:HEAT repeat protein
VVLLDEVRAGVVVSTLLATSQDPDNLTAALRHARSPALLPDVVRLARHPAWPVRTQAATALGRLGGAEERGLLLDLLSDPQWWVRYRAAQALFAGRMGTRDELAALAGGLGDRFARDIVAQVLAEGG